MSYETKHPNALPIGTVLNGQYRIVQVLGQGGFGITYLGEDLNLELKVAIKEYYPEGMVTRDYETREVTVYAGDKREDFEYGAERFLEEAKILGRFQNNAHIVGVRNFFRENGTAYFVMDYIEGISFKDYLKQMNGCILYQDAFALLIPIMEALEEVHQIGLLHRDISPDNIYITFEGKSKLLDFGAARSTLGEHSKSLSVILKPGYAPEEQYRSKGKQGPWTDVYALSATLYMAITGQLPPEALDRLDEDDLRLPSELGIDVPKHIEYALGRGLSIKAYDRYQSIKELRDGLLDENFVEVKMEQNNEKIKKEDVEVSVVEKEVDKVPLQIPTSQNNKKQIKLAIGVGIATIGVLLVLGVTKLLGDTEELSGAKSQQVLDIVVGDEQSKETEKESEKKEPTAEEIEQQKAQEEALKEEALKQEIKTIADKSYTHIKLEDHKGDSYTAYVYADNATQEIASMDNATVWAGASEGNLLVTGDFKIAYVKENGTEIKTYDLGKDIGYNTTLNMTWNADCKRENLYDGQPDFMVITIPETSNSAFYYAYVMYNGELKEVQFSEGAWYTALMEQIGPTTFGVAQQDIWETGLYMFDEIQYDIKTQTFKALTGERMMTPLNYSYYNADNARELTKDDALNIITSAHDSLWKAFTFYDEFSDVKNEYMKSANFIVGTKEKMKGFLRAYWSEVYVDAFMNQYSSYFEEIDGTLYILEDNIEGLVKNHFDFTSAEIIEMTDNGEMKTCLVSIYDYVEGRERIVRYTLTYTSTGWVMFDGGDHPLF